MYLITLCLYTLFIHSAIHSVYFICLFLTLFHSSSSDLHVFIMYQSKLSVKNLRASGQNRMQLAKCHPHWAFSIGQLAIPKDSPSPATAHRSKSLGFDPLEFCISM